MIWNKNRESLDREDLEGIQLKSLQVLLEKIYSNVPFYRKKFDKAGVKPGDLKSLADLGKFPFTTKDELRDTYPFGLLAIPKEEIVEVHPSSGTTGIPVLGAHSRGDIELWSESMARTLAAAGAGPGDIIQNAYGYGLFTGGLGVHYGARKLGLCVIPISAGNTKRQLMVMKDFQATILACTPSYALYMAEAAREEGFDLKE